MKKLVLMLIAALSFSYAMAQEELDFPFQGGSQVMTDYFAQHLTVSSLIKQRGASGTVVMKFTADDKGGIIKMVVYYADDASLIEPVINALKGTNGKWIIPAKQKFYDFVIPFSIVMDNPTPKASKAILQYMNTKSPIVSTDQIPLNLVTLLPAISVKYTYEPPAIPAKPAAKKSAKKG
jgi:hypothetical protein